MTSATPTIVSTNRAGAPSHAGSNLSRNRYALNPTGTTTSASWTAANR
ncbi:MAG TPA: hypothetical protein VFS54_03565 [Solirubrobacterales bacterium]|nr:hypothetical protein [Solirubrobacterales bacterium]